MQCHDKSWGGAVLYTMVLRGCVIALVGSIAAGPWYVSVSHVVFDRNDSKTY